MPADNAGSRGRLEGRPDRPGARLLQRQIVVPITVSAALFMQQASATALATALPVIATDLGEPVLRLHLVLTSYLLSLAVFLPLSGWIADRLGARLVFRLAVLVFTGASFLCGLAPNLELMVLARVLQGMGGAMMVPVGRLVLVRSVPKAQLIRAMVLMSMPAQVGPITGPIIGGLLTTYASWHWVFWVNIPMGAVAIVLATLFFEDTAGPERRRFDVRGFALSAVGLAATVCGLDSLSSGLLPLPLALGCLGAGLAAGALYVAHARLAADPILDLRLLRVATFRIAVLGGNLFRIGIGALPFLLPLLLQRVFHHSALEAGLVTFATAAGSFGMRAVATKVLRRLGFKRTLIGTALLGSASIAACALFTAETPWLAMVAILFVGGLFRSLQFTSTNAMTFADIEPAQMSHATSFSSMVQQLALSSGVALSAFILHLAAPPGTPLTTTAFATAFIGVAALSGVAVLFYLALPSQAGNELTGRKVKAAV